MTGERAVAILSGLLQRHVGFTADEIEELLAHRLVVEADPEHLATIEWLVPAVREHAGVEMTDPLAAPNLMQAIAEHDQKLQSDWYRFTTGDDKIAARTAARRQARRALAYLTDKVMMDALLKVLSDSRYLAPGTAFVADPALGVELYGVTARGAEVVTQLALRLDRYGAHPLAAFLKNYDKVDAKMRAFAAEIETLTHNIGYVKKNPHQVVIGLAKTGVPAAQVVGTYRAAAQRSGGMTDVAVTLTRNAQQFGSTDAVAKRLARAQQLLRQAGYQATPVVMGVAKSLLPFEPLETGLARFRELCSLLSTTIGASGDSVLKAAARLMPAKASPGACVQFVQQVTNQLVRQPSANRQTPMLATAVALASMVDQSEEIPPLVARYRAIEDALARRRISHPAHAGDDALECVGCPGTPVEVVDTVASLLARVAARREPGRADVAVAVAFAKRFAI
jgi:hypothetical protein